jgi:transposase
MRIGIVLNNTVAFTKKTHLDGTSMSVHGEYKIKGEEDFIVGHESSEPIGIAIMQGYSRDHRPDLKQFTLHLLTSAECGLQ